jgi:hypothetical protein
MMSDSQMKSSMYTDQFLPLRYLQILKSVACILAQVHLGSNRRRLPAAPSR